MKYAAPEIKSIDEDGVNLGGEIVAYILDPI